MKFTSHTNFMRALTGLVRDGWDIYKIEINEFGTTIIQLSNSNLELFYTLEHHIAKESIEQSTLKPFVKFKQVANIK